MAFELFFRAKKTFPKAPEPRSFSIWKDLKLTLAEPSMSSVVDFVERVASFGEGLACRPSSRKRRFLFKRRSSSLGSSYSSTAVVEERAKQFCMRFGMFSVRFSEFLERTEQMTKNSFRMGTVLTGRIPSGSCKSLLGKCS